MVEEFRKTLKLTDIKEEPLQLQEQVSEVISLVEQRHELYERLKVKKYRYTYQESLRYRSYKKEENKLINQITELTSKINSKLKDKMNSFQQ